MKGEDFMLNTTNTQALRSEEGGTAMMTTTTTQIQLSEKQIAFYKEQAQIQANARGLEVASVDVYVTEEGKVKVAVQYAPSAIERVRRVTGYFCKLDNVNDAKKAEIEQRIPHRWN